MLQAYIKPAHGVIQNQNILDEDVDGDLDPQEDSRAMDLQDWSTERRQDSRPLQSHWLHYFPWLMLTEDKYLCR